MIIPHDSVEIVEVGPRDGLQNLPEFVKTEQKVTLIKRLAESGLREMQIGSFVSPVVVPQFRDIKEIADQTDVSINTALGRMRYALINMRKLIQEKNLTLTVY